MIKATNVTRRNIVTGFDMTGVKGVLLANGVPATDPNVVETYRQMLNTLLTSADRGEAFIVEGRPEICEESAADCT